MVPNPAGGGTCLKDERGALVGLPEWETLFLLCVPDGVKELPRKKVFF
jgi:hypothetical protein